MHTHLYGRSIKIVSLAAVLVLVLVSLAFLPKADITKAAWGGGYGQQYTYGQNFNNNYNSNTNTNINTNYNSNNGNNWYQNRNPVVPFNPMDTNGNYNQNYNYNNNVNTGNYNNNYNQNPGYGNYNNGNYNYNSNINSNYNNNGYNNNYNGNYNYNYNNNCNGGSCGNNSCYNNNCNNNYGVITVQTLAATNIYSNSATLNGYLNSATTNGGTNSVWFQWGTTTAYGYETSHLQQSNSGPFSQAISGLIPGNTYHYRAVAQDAQGNIVYGQDMTIYCIPQVLGASYVSTGLTNDFLKDSFFLPLLLLLIGAWFFVPKMFARKKAKQI